MDYTEHNEKWQPICAAYTVAAALRMLADNVPHLGKAASARYGSVDEAHTAYLRGLADAIEAVHPLHPLSERQQSMLFDYIEAQIADETTRSLVHDRLDTMSLADKHETLASIELES